MNPKSEIKNRFYGQFKNHLPARATVLLLALATASSPAQTYTVLHAFSGSAGGANPYGGLTLSGTNLYGTTAYGGSYGYGTVFKMHTDGTGFAVLHNFTGSDGSSPEAALVLSGTTLYGTTPYTLNYFGGIVFKLNTDGSGFRVLKQYSSGNGGGVPVGGLVLSGTNLYGTTEYTAIIGGGASGYGTIFKMNTDGSDYTVLWNFSGTNGNGPCATLLLDGPTLYGTTWGGGSFPDFNCGTVFRVNTDGTGFMLLQSFTITNGDDCFGSLVLSGTTLYGTTWYGGNVPGGGLGAGTVFKLNTDGSGFDLLKSFYGTNGAAPSAGMSLSGTTLYGTTTYTKIDEMMLLPTGFGTVFQLNTDGTGFRVLKQFTGGDGGNPYAGLVLSGSTLYGTTWDGGSSNNGVVFSVSIAPPTASTFPQNQTAEIGSPVDFTPDIAGCPPVTCQLFFNGTCLMCCGTDGCLILTNADFSMSGTYTVVVTNLFGAVTSAPITLNVIPPVERRPVPGINLMGDAGSMMYLDYADSLSPAVNWSTLDSVTLTGTSELYFDLTKPLPPLRFYRIWQTGTPSVVPSLTLPAMIPAITLTGNIGDKLRVDYINQFGPTDAWVTLDTVTLTNTSQLYFDVSAPGQPVRLWRIVPVP